MNLLSVLLAATAALSASVSADDSYGTVHGNVPAIPQVKEVKAGVNATAPAAGNSSASGNGTTAASGASLTSLKQKSYGSEYHMPYIRVVHARAQGDKPIFMEGRFVSSLGDGDLKSSYRAAMDTVNTASVEGALLFVQAEGINQNSRSASDRCTRRSNMTYIVFYDILIAQTNESLAQYQDTWNVPEYGPYMAMDAGRCTPSSGNDVFQPGCYQYNGDKDQPAVGPVIGSGAKNDDVRAPYPNALWFSFPNTCPLEVWGNKRDPNNACRASTRKGLCDMGKAPDGVECTYAYDILGWVTIDDVVGITALTDDSGKNYTSYKQWCEASSNHIEFAGDDKTGKMDKGLPFWEEPLDTKRNAERASRVIELYQDVVAGAFKSSGISADDVKHFKDLPDPKDLTKTNPPCYKTVKTCNSGNGCKRSFFSQVCMPCKDASPDCKVDPSFKFPALEKPKTKLSEDQTTTKLGGKNDASGKLGATSPSAGGSSGNSTSGGKSAASTTGSAATIAALLVAVVAAML